MALQPGDVALLRYDIGGRALFHERLILCVIPSDPGNFGILTPDHDVYLEEIRGGNADLHSFHSSEGIGHRPRAIGNAVVHGFGEPYPTIEEMRVFIRDACLQANVPLPPLPLNVLIHGSGPLYAVGEGDGVVPFVGPGGPAPGPGPAVPVHGAAASGAGVGAQAAGPGLGPPSVGGAAVPGPGPMPGAPVAGANVVDAIPLSALSGLVPDPGRWILDEPHVAYDIGQAFQLPASFVVPPGATRVICSIGGDESVLKFLRPGVDVNTYVSARCGFLCHDRRTIEVPGANDGKSVSSLLNEMTVVPGGLPHGLDSSPTGPWFFQEVAISGKSFALRDSTWKAESGVPSQLPLTYEHEVLSCFFDYAVLTDRLNIKNLVCCEWLVRRLQLIESAVLENPMHPSFDGARYFMGKGARKGGALIAPDLRSHVASEYAKEAALQKEKRKALEARKSAQEGGKADKKGKGGNPKAPPEG